MRAPRRHPLPAPHAIPGDRYALEADGDRRILTVIAVTRNDDSYRYHLANEAGTKVEAFEHDEIETMTRADR